MWCVCARAAFVVLCLVWFVLVLYCGVNIACFELFFLRYCVFFVFFLYVSCVRGVCYHVVLCIVVYAVLFMFLMFFC